MEPEDKRLSYVQDRLQEFGTTHPEGLIEHYGVEAVWTVIQEVSKQSVRNPGAWVRRRLAEGESEGKPTAVDPAEFIRLRQALYDLGVPQPAAVVDRYGLESVRECLAALGKEDPRPDFPRAWVLHALKHGVPRRVETAPEVAPESPAEAAYRRDLGFAVFRQGQQAVFRLAEHLRGYTLLDHQQAVAEPEPWDSRTLEARRTAYGDALQRDYLAKHPDVAERQEKIRQERLARQARQAPPAAGETWRDKLWREHPELLRAQEALYSELRAKEGA